MTQSPISPDRPVRYRLQFSLRTMLDLAVRSVLPTWAVRGARLIQFGNGVFLPVPGDSLQLLEDNVQKLVRTGGL